MYLRNQVIHFQVDIFFIWEYKLRLLMHRFSKCSLFFFRIAISVKPIIRSSKSRRTFCKDFNYSSITISVLLCPPFNMQEKGNPFEVVVTALYCDIIVSEFELQWGYHVHFRTSTLGGGKTLLTSSGLYSNHCCSSTRVDLTLNYP